LTGLLCSLPTTLATVVAMVVAGLLSAGCLLAVHRLIPHNLRSLHNDIAGFVLAIVGVIYAVLLAFIAIAVWENYTAADNLVQTEANLVGDLYRATISLPDDVAQGLRRDLFAYTEAVGKTEWPELAGGKVMQHGGWLALDNVHLKLAALHQEDPGTLAAQTSMLHMLNQLYDVRRGRFHAAAASLPEILWWNLLAGGGILIVFSCLFGVPRLAMHAVMVGLLGASIGLVLMLIVLLDNPFRGRSHVSAEPFDSLSKAVETMEYPGFMAPAMRVR
jgi:Protein of unknown function (DUF4239)